METENREFMTSSGYAWCEVRAVDLLEALTVEHIKPIQAFSCSLWCPGGLTTQNAFLKSLLITPSIAQIIDILRTRSIKLW